jgi:biotin carboxylase
MAKKKVLIINLGWEQEPLIQKFNNSEWEVFGVNGSEVYNHKEIFKEVLITDVRDLQAILNFSDKIMPDAVISDQCDYSHFAQAMVAKKHHLPGPSLEHAQISLNKFLQRERCRKGGVTIPDYKLVTDPSDIDDFIAKVGYPVITKPVDNRGSFGVVKIEKKEDILPAFFEALVNSHSRLVLVEKFIEGVQITVDGYCFDGKGKTMALATKGMVDEHRQVAVDIKYPGDLEPSIYEKAVRNNEFTIEQLGYKFGMTHAEYMVTPKGEIYLIEAANRGGGVFTSEIIVPNVSGIDILTRYVQDCTGLASDIKYKEPEKNPVILKFFSFGPGFISEIKGRELVTGDKNVLHFRMSVKEGDLIRPITNDGNRHGFVIVKNSSNIRKHTDEIIQKIKVVYK